MIPTEDPINQLSLPPPIISDPRIIDPGTTEVRDPGTTGQTTPSYYVVEKSRG